MTAIRGRLALLALLAALSAVAAVVATVVADDNAPGDAMLAENAIDLSPLDRVPAATWDALARKRIFFGHQSVGYDLVAGIEEICRRKPEVRLHVVETDDLSRLDGPALAHARVGVNTDPASKIAHFARIMESPGSETIDIALLKLCYVDVGTATGVDDLHARYEGELARLEAARPRTKFVRTTVPLTARQTGLKAGLKRLAGRVPGNDADNGARAAYNGLVRDRSPGKHPIVDVAASESTLPDGTGVSVRCGGGEYPCLARCYTTDGGHLNGAGRLAAARDMLLVLAELAR